jgi:hypothetical protein
MQPSHQTNIAYVTYLLARFGPATALTYIERTGDLTSYPASIQRLLQPLLPRRDAHWPPFEAVTAARSAISRSDLQGAYRIIALHPDSDWLSELAAIEQAQYRQRADAKPVALSASHLLLYGADPHRLRAGGAPLHPR